MAKMRTKIRDWLTGVIALTCANPGALHARTTEPGGVSTEDVADEVPDGAEGPVPVVSDAGANDQLDRTGAPGGEASESAQDAGDSTESERASEASPDAPANAGQSGGSDPAPEAPTAEGETKRLVDPYEGLDHSGSPPGPPEQSNDPQGRWDDRYDGRPKKRRAEDTLIWIPRAPLYPVHLLLNYGVRWPLVTGIAKAEEVRLFHRVHDLFTFDDGKGGYYPTAFFDKGRGLWGGAHFFYDDLGVEGHSVKATAGGGTNGWVLGTFTDSWRVFDDERGMLAFNVLYLRSPNLAFTGLGSATDIEDEVFFTSEQLGGKVSLDVAFADLNRFYTALEYRRARLSGSGRDPEFGESPFAPLADELTGFKSWFDLATFEMRLELDTRRADRQFTSGSGLRWESWAAYNFGMAEEVLSYFRYGVEPTVHWDLTGVNHVLSLSVTAEALSKTAGDDPPLSERITLGGSELMQAFLPGRFRGDSALVYGAAYSWPVLAFADALVFTDLGTTYGGFYDDFSHDKMALSWGTGARTSFSRSFGIELLVAWGSNRIQLWDDQFAVDNVRFVAGVGSGVGR